MAAKVSLADCKADLPADPGRSLKTARIDESATGRDRPASKLLPLTPPIHGGDKRDDDSDADEEIAAHVHAAQQESLLGSRVNDWAARWSP